MKNFEKNLEEATEAELSLWINNYDFRVVPLASDELTRRAIKRLNESINKNITQLKEFADASKDSSRIAEKFTLALFILAMVQILVAVFQLIMSFAYSNNGQAIVLGITMVVAVSAMLVYFLGQIFPKKSK